MAMILPKKVLSAIREHARGILVGRITFIGKRNQSSLTCEEMIRNYYSAKATPEYRIKVGKQYINYTTSGHGPHKVLLLPAGITTARQSFHSQISGFDEQQFTLIGWDLPGYYKSTPPGPDYSGNFMHRESELAYEFMQYLGINYYSVLGLCAGCTRGMMLAAEHPEVVNKLVLYSAHNPSDFLLEYWYKFDKRNPKNELNVNLDKDYCYGASVMAPCFENINIYRKHATMFLNERTEYYKRHNIMYPKMLNNIVSPTLFLYGTKDEYTSEAQIAKLMKDIKNSRAQGYNGGHFFHMEYPEDVNKRTQEFLTSAS